MSDDERKTITREDAEAHIKSWAEFYEMDPERDHFKDVIDELSFPVMKGRLDFDPTDEVFRYQLIKPIRHENSTRELVEIREGNFAQNKVLERFKDNESISQAAALLTRRTNLNLAEVDQLSDRDVSRINAVILGFFVQTRSSR